METGRLTRIERVRIARSFIGKPFELGKVDCIQMLHKTYPEMPTEWEGFTLDNYYEGYDPIHSSSFLIRFIQSWTIRSSIPLLPGDIILHKSPFNFVGIYIGNNIEVTISERVGGRIGIFPYREKREPING